MTLNVRSFYGHKKIIECYLNDHQVHVAVIVESNTIKSKLDKIEMTGFKCTNHCCRKDEPVKGGGGGGILIFAHDSVPYLKGQDMEVREKNELEFCATTVYPNYNYEQSIEIVGVYRPLKGKHPPYEPTLQKILRRNKEHQVTTIIAGDLNINSWKTEYHD